MLWKALKGGVGIGFDFIQSDAQGSLVFHFPSCLYGLHVKKVYVLSLLQTTFLIGVEEQIHSSVWYVLYSVALHATYQEERKQRMFYVFGWLSQVKNGNITSLGSSFLFHQITQDCGWCTAGQADCVATETVDVLCGQKLNCFWGGRRV